MFSYDLDITIRKGKKVSKHTIASNLVKKTSALDFCVLVCIMNSCSFCKIMEIKKTFCFRALPVLLKLIGYIHPCTSVFWSSLVMESVEMKQHQHTHLVSH